MGLQGPFILIRVRDLRERNIIKNTDNPKHAIANTSPNLEYRVSTFSMGTFWVITASLKICVVSMTRPEGPINPLIPVFAARTRDRRFSTALKTDMEKC
jgi:hypothetical protein